MARMSIDDKFPRDPRVIKLGRRCGWSRRETMGALIDVFQIVYDRERDTLPVEDIDIAAEFDGFAAHMIACDLAEQTRSGVRIRGAAERIGYLKHNADAGRIGGVKSGQSRRNRREAVLRENRSDASSKPEALGNPLAPALALPSAPVPDPALVPERERGETEDAPDEPAPPRPALLLVQEPAKRGRRRKNDFECSEDERAAALRVLAKLGDRNGTAYTGCAAHLKLIVGRMRDGIPEMDLRKVIAFCADGKKWEDDPKMRAYLTPETLFGPETIHKYLDQARSWAARAYPDQEGATP